MHSSGPKPGAGGEAAPGAAADGLDETIDASGTVTPSPPSSRATGEPAGDYPALLPVDPDHYVIGAEIAHGGMGRILEARDKRLGRAVAIKELLPGHGESSRRFENEARITARLQHPAIVNVYEAGVWPGGEPFYAMKRVSGRSLDKVVAERKTLAARLALLPNLIAVADALAYAHSQRVIHRDLKPGNILVGEFGETVVIDWGLAKDLAATVDEPRAPSRPLYVVDGETQAGSVVGTPAYMPPEQARGDAVDERTDVYALGAVLYHVLAGRAPYSTASGSALVERVLAQAATPLAQREPGVPPDLVTVVTKAMAREPAARYPSARELAADLKRFQTGQLVAAHHYTRGERLTRWLRRHRAPLAVGGAAFVTLVALGGVSLQRILEERSALRVARNESDRQRDRARRERVHLLEEQGRQELLAGRAGRALAYLSSAYSAYQEGDSTSLRFLLAEAIRPFQAEQRALAASEGPLAGAAFSPGGDRIATLARNGEVTLWSATSGERLRSFRAHSEGAGSLAFSPGGERLVTTGAGRAARVWDTGSGRLLVELAHEAGVLHAAFDADGERVITAGEDGRARVWQLPAGRLTRTLDAHAGPVRAVAFNDDGTLVVTAGDDHTAIVWELASGRPRARLQGHSDRVRSAVFRRDDAQVLTASDDGKAHVWELPSGRLLLAVTGHGGAVLSAAYSPDQQAIVTASADRTARVWDAATGAQRVDLEGHRGRVTQAAFDPSGARIVTSGDDGTARLWDARPRTLLARLTPGGQLTHAAFSPAGDRIVTASSDGTARIFPAGEADPAVTLAGHGQIVFSAAFSPDGTRVVTAGGDETVRVWDASTGAQLAVLRGHRGSVYAAAFDPRGERVVSGGEDRTARIWQDDRTVRLLEGHDAKVGSVAFDPTGAHVLTASLDGYARVFDAVAGTLDRRVGRGPGITMAAYGPGGDRIVTAGADGSVHVWEDSGTVIPLEQPGLLSSAAFSPSGRRVVTASLDGRVEILDAYTGKLLSSRQAHEGAVLSAVFSPDGTRLLTAGRDGTARVWDVHADESPPGVIAGFVEERVPWRLIDGRLVARVSETR